jgi:hypothetical protein
MFRNRSGNLCVDAEEIAERIRRLPSKDIDALEERKNILRNALNSFGARLQDLPQRERNAALSLFYKEVLGILFDFQLSIETSAAHQKITTAVTKEEKREALSKFRSITEDLAMLYGVA